METRSNHVLVGGVVLVMIAMLIGFTVWLARLSGGSDHEYDIFFKTAVDGLAKGSGVAFAGVPAGQVVSIALMPEQPDFVRVRISVREDVPVLQGTTATIQGIGFTGVSQIQLDGAIKGAPPITCPEGESNACPYGVPVIPTKPGALGELLSSAPQLLERFSTLTERLGTLLNDRNQRSISGILANFDRLSASLAERGPEIAATLAETRIAVRQAGEAAEQIGKLAGSADRVVRSDVQPLLANLNDASASAKRSMDRLDSAIADAQPGLKAFSTQTIPEVSQLVRDLTEMSEALTAVASRLNRGGAGALIGGGKLPDYEPE